MKETLREALLARHAARAPDLDALRRAALPQRPLSGLEFLRELFVPVRLTWGTLALVWLLLLIMRLSSPPAPVSNFSIPQGLALCSTSKSQIDAIFSETGTLR